uniref:Phosphoribosyl pyrophosphate synthase-associated protein 2 n=1 Tax=Triatoma infestans TaxID=30076 RepID=A0A170VS94_TRIIF
MLSEAIRRIHNKESMSYLFKNVTTLKIKKLIFFSLFSFFLYLPRILYYMVHL